MGMQNYTTIDNPYDSNLNRTNSDAAGQDGLLSSGNSAFGTTGNYLSTPAYSGGTLTAADQAEGLAGKVTIDGNTWLETWIKSRNYKPRVSGFMIDGLTGDAEFGKGFFRGRIEADSGFFHGDISGATGHFTGTVDVGSINIGGDDTTSAHIDEDGNFWAGASVADKDTAPARISNEGLAVFTGATIDSTSLIAGISCLDIAFAANPTADNVPGGLTCSSTTAVVGPDGTVSSSAILTWTAISTGTFDHYQIRYKKHTSTYYTYLTSKTNTVTIEGLVPNVSYDFGLASVNKAGISSAFSIDIVQTTATSTTAPATVTTGSATAGIQYVILEWTHNTDPDLASYNIYRNTTNDSGTASLIGNCRTNYFVDGGRTGGQIYYYWIKAVNTSGLLSAAFSVVKSATPRNVENGDIADTVTIAAGKVLIDGEIYLSNWRHSEDITKIDGGNIFTGSITTGQLNFTPVETDSVIASINASEEGIQITAEHISIAGSTTFLSEASDLGMPHVFYTTPTTPYRVGDFWVDGSVFKKCNTELLTGVYNAAHWELATAYTDDTTANTKAKTFIQAAVPTSVSAGDLWIDSDDNNKLYRATSAGNDEIAAGEWVAVPYSDAGKISSGGAATDVNANATTISGAKITTGSLAADRITSGTITSGIISLASSLEDGDCYIATGKTDFGSTTSGFILGIDHSDSDYAKFEIGDANSYLKYSPTTGLSLYTNMADGIIVDHAADITLKEGGSINLVSLAGPVSALTATLIIDSSGGLSYGSYEYLVTYVNSAGETPYDEDITASVMTGEVSRQVLLSNIPISPSGSVIARKIYRTKCDYGDVFYLLTTINDNSTTTYTDGISDNNLGRLIDTRVHPVDTTFGGIKVNGQVVLNFSGNDIRLGKNVSNYFPNRYSQAIYIGDYASQYNIDDFDGISLGQFSRQEVLYGSNDVAVGGQAMEYTKISCGNVGIGFGSFEHLNENVAGIIDSFEDYGGGTVRANCKWSHHLTTGDLVKFRGDLYRSAITNVITVIDNYSFYFTASWAGTSDVAVWELCDSSGYGVAGYYNTAVGFCSGYHAGSGSNNIFLGPFSGSYETGSNKLIINYLSPTDEADGRSHALLYGVMAPVPASQKLTINALLNLSVTKTPASASATGTTGDVAWDASYIYVCTATDTWKRAAIATWT